MKIQKLTKEQAVIISAYTGILCCEFPDLHEYIERKLNRPVWTHELANEKVMFELKEKSRADFLAICPILMTP
jgi:hypothetical protein